MTRTEFTKFIKTLKKDELIKIVLDLTKRKTDLQEKIYLEFNKEEEINLDLEHILAEFKKVSQKVFTKNWMTINSAVVGKYCRMTNKLITTYIEPLIKRKSYYDAAYLLVEVYYLTLNELGFSIYKYGSSESYFNKIEKDFRNILDNTKDLERYRIAKLILKNLHQDWDPILFVFSLEDLYAEYFENEAWEKEKERILVDHINIYLEDFDETRPISDNLSILVYELLTLKNDQNTSPEELEEYFKRYHFVGEVYRFQAEQLLKEGEPIKARNMLDKILQLPTASQEDLEQNSLLQIKILRELKEDKYHQELLKELKHNLDCFYQSNIDILFEYWFNLPSEKLKKSYDYYKGQPTTKNLYNDEEFTSSSLELIRDLKSNKFDKVTKWNSTFIEFMAPYGAKWVAEYFIYLAKLAMKDGSSDKNYRETEINFKKIFDNVFLKPYFEIGKKKLTEAYPRREKLKDVFKRIETGKSWY